MIRVLLTIAVMVGSAAPAVAQSNSWERALRTKKDNKGKKVVALTPFEKQMREGDRLARTAIPAARGGIPLPIDSRARYQVDRAILAYRRAIALNPKAAEPHYRIASLIDVAYLSDARGGGYTTLERAMARRAIDHWKTFEKLAPLDPRIKHVLNPRSLIHTKLEDYKSAIADYERLLARSDLESLDGGEAARVLGNLAEIYMMVGKIERAIPLYRRALGYFPDASTAYGLAVALDRDGQATRARMLLRTYASESALKLWMGKVRDGLTFYVPSGEVYYYLALMHEVTGNYGKAIKRYRDFIASGAHKRFQPRAAEHVKRLQAAMKSGKYKPPTRNDWRERWDNRP